MLALILIAGLQVDEFNNIYCKDEVCWIENDADMFENPENVVCDDSGCHNASGQTFQNDCGE